MRSHRLCPIEVAVSVLLSSYTPIFAATSPDAADDAFTLNKNSMATVLPVLQNDQGEGLKITGYGGQPVGTISLTNGTLIYRPPADFAGKDSFNYTMADSAGRGDVAFVIVTVVNQRPVANAGADYTVYTAGATIPVQLDGRLSNDPDGDALTYRWYKANSTAAVVGTSAVQIVPVPVGDHTFVLTTNDSAGLWTWDAVVIRVLPAPATKSRAVLLVHGMFGDGPNTWQSLTPVLSAPGAYSPGAGFIVEAVRFLAEAETKSNAAPVSDQARAVARRVRELIARSGEKQVNLVCHSLGGLAAREYLRNTALWPRNSSNVPYSGVAKLVLIAAPNWGVDGALNDPITTVIAARFYGQPKVDTHLRPSLALRDAFAEWRPPPEASSGNKYPSGFKLSTWALDSKLGVLSPLKDQTYDVAKTAQKLVPAADAKVIGDAVAAFPFDPAQRSKASLAYYRAKSAEMGTLHRSSGSGNVRGVNGRNVSACLMNLNVHSKTPASVPVHLIAGTQNLFYLWNPANASQVLYAGPGGYSIPSDGNIPLDSALGIDPISKASLFPNAKKLVLDANHIGLLYDARAISQTRQWLAE